MNQITGWILIFLGFALAYLIKKAIAKRQGKEKNLSFITELKSIFFPKKAFKAWLIIVLVIFLIVILAVLFRKV